MKMTKEQVRAVCVKLESIMVDLEEASGNLVLEGLRELKMSKAREVVTRKEKALAKCAKMVADMRFVVDGK